MLTRGIQAAITSIIFHGVALWFGFLFLRGEKEELMKKEFTVQFSPVESQIESTLFREGVIEKKQWLEDSQNLNSTTSEETVDTEPDLPSQNVTDKEVKPSKIYPDSPSSDMSFNVQKLENIPTNRSITSSELVPVQGWTENIIISTPSKDWLVPEDSSVMSGVRSIIAEQLAQTNSPKLEQHFTEDTKKSLLVQTGVVSRKFKWDKLERTIIRGADISYPELLAINAIEADLEVQLTISPEGSISNVVLINSSGYSSVDAEVMQSFKMQQFTVGNQETIVSVIVEFQFLRSF